MDRAPAAVSDLNIDFLKRHYKQIGSAINTRDIPLVLSIAGCEQDLTATVRYVNVPGNPERFDEPARDDSVEVLSVIVRDVNILFMLDEQTIESIMGEVS